MSFFDFFRKKKTDKSTSKNENLPRLCFVMCKTVEPGDLSNASKIVADVLGAEYSAEFDREQIVTVTRGEETVGFLAHMPAAIPGTEAQDSADGNFLWPNGREEVAEHQSHVIVTNIGAGNQTPIQSAINVSRLAIVALKLFDGIGVYWGNASVCNSRAIFEDFCQDMTQEHVPVPLWLRFQPFNASDDGIGMYTLGMNQFDLMDIEVDRCSMDIGDLFEFVSNIAYYLIQSGPVIGDGNTVGGSAEERILVRHRPSLVDKSKKVYKIVFET